MNPETNSKLPLEIFQTSKTEPGILYESPYYPGYRSQESRWGRIWRFCLLHWNLFVDWFHIGPWGEDY